MSQQEFEPPGQPRDEEISPLRYPYRWSEQPQQRGMPRDEPPGASGSWSGQTGSQFEQLSPAPVPTRVQTRRRQKDPLVIVSMVTLGIFLILVAAWVVLASFLPGTILYQLTVAWIAWGAILALLIYACLLIALLLRMIFRAAGRGKRHQGNRFHETMPGPR